MSPLEVLNARLWDAWLLLCLRLQAIGNEILYTEKLSVKEEEK